MKKILSVFIFLTLIYFSHAKPAIYTTVKPIADIISEISGEKVSYLIPPGVSFHIYEFKISDLQKAYKADLFVYLGAGEPKLSGLLESIPKNKRVKVIDIKGLKLLEDKDEDEHSVHPVLWLDPDNAAVLAKFFAKKLSILDPENKSEYQRNLSNFLEKLKNLKEYGKKKIGSLKNKKFISYHYAWPYFTKAFGLDYVGVIEMGHGREPTPKHILNLIRIIKKYRIKSIFAAKQFYNRKYGELIVREAGVKIIFLDPFGINKNYIEMMKFNIDRVYQGLSQ